ncbi:hypothetical protein FKM82_026661 [Ascaphus truei]
MPPAMLRVTPAPPPRDRSAPPPAVSGTFSLPQIIFTEWTSNPPSPTGDGAERGGGTDLRGSGGREIHDLGVEERAAWSYPAVSDHAWTSGGSPGLLEQQRTRYRGDKGHSMKGQSRHGDPPPSCVTQAFLSDRSTDTRSDSRLGGADVSALHTPGSSAWEGEAGDEEDIVGFMITKDSIVSLTREEKKGLERERGGEAHTPHVTRVGGGCSETLQDDFGVQSDHNPVLVVFEEPLTLEDAYKRLWSITLCEEGSGGAGEVPHTDLTFQRRIEESNGSNDQKLPLPDHSDPTEEVRREQVPKPNFPVPKPRHLHGKDLNPPRLKHIDMSTLHCGTLAGSMQSDAVSKLSASEVCKIRSLPEAGAAHAQGGPQEVTETPLTGDGGPGCHLSWRSMDICRKAYKRLDSLEESIRELELTMSEIGSEQPAAFPLKAPAEGHPQAEELGGDAERGQRDPQSLSPRADEPSLPSAPRELEAAGSGSPARSKPPLLPKPRIAQV